MAEKCTKCGHSPIENKKGYLCPVCGDYFCYDCLKDVGEKEEPKVFCPFCEEVIQLFFNNDY